MRKKIILMLLAACMLTGCNSNESAKTEKETTVEKETEKETTKKPVQEKIDLSTIEAGITENFMYGVDVSTLIAQENSGVVYYDEDGQEKDLLYILANNGVNMVRIRVWNDPYDENENGYGGGNCDLPNALALGKRVTDNGMSCMIDFHYSDFWADPSKQMCPKEWKGMTLNEKSDALYEYTKDALKQLLDDGVDVKMVQLGNEITSGMSGETNWTSISALLNSGSKAVREIEEEYKTDIDIVLHFTNPEKGKYVTYANNLKNNNVDYDVFASSYYPFWHGTYENLEKVLGQIVQNFGKKVMVAEISYAYTMEDGDGHQNSIYEGAWGDFTYEISEESQIQVVKDCVETLSTFGEYAVGVCYWEPAWIPVPVEEGQDRSEIWEKYGSGWASSYAGGYDPKDAGEYYGGSAWDNQAWFDSEGKPLSSLNTYEQIKEELGEKAE